MSKIPRKFLVAFILLLVFMLYTFVVMKVDVEPLEVMDAEHNPTTIVTPVGLAGLNQFFRDLVEDHPLAFTADMWYTFTKLLAAFSLACGGAFGVVGLIQLIRKKNLFKVHYAILLLGCLYVLLGVLYVAFDKVVVINCRPALEADGTLEASFPSSHTMLVVTIMSSGMVAARRLIRSFPLRALLDTLAIVVMLGMVVGRLYSGVHWFTDILGGVLISAMLTAFYSAFVALVGRNVRRSRRRRRAQAQA